MQTSNEVTPLPIVEDPGLIYRGEGPATDSTRPATANEPTWGVFGALFVWFLSILLVIFLPLAFLIPYAFYRGISFGVPNYPQVLVEFATNDKTAVLLQILALLPIHLITILLVWALVTRFGRQSFRAAIGWEWSTTIPRWADLLLSVMLGIVLFGLGNVIARLLGAEKPTQLEQIINSSLAARYTIAFLAVFTAPFAEEFIYRGVLYSALRKTVGVYCAWLLAFVFGARLGRHTQDRIGVNGAVVLVLALFTIIHVPQYWPNFGVIAAVALLSIVLTVVRAYTGRLLPCIVIHIVFNGIQALLLIFQPYFQRFFPTPDQVPPTTGLLLSLINLCF